MSDTLQFVVEVPYAQLLAHDFSTVEQHLIDKVKRIEHENNEPDHE